MSRTSKALKRLGVAGLAAVTIGAGVPALIATPAQAAPGGATTQLTLTPSTQAGAAGACIVYSVTPLNATGETPSDTSGQTIKLEATENPATDTQQIHFCTPTAPFANTGTTTRLNETTDVGNTTTAKSTAVAPADPNASGAQTFGVRGRVPGGASLRAYIDTNTNGSFDAGEPTVTGTATFNAGGSDNTSDITAGGNSAQDAVKTIAEIAQSASANPVAAGNTSASDQYVTVQVKNTSGDPVSGVAVSAAFGSGSANGAQTSPSAPAQTITCAGGGTTTDATTGVTTRTTNTAAHNAAGGGSQNGGPVTNNAGILTCSYTALRAGSDTLVLFVNQTTGGTSGADSTEPQITVTRTTQTAPNTDATKARFVDLTPEGPVNTVSGQSRVWTATVTDTAGKRVQGVAVCFYKTGGGNLIGNSCGPNTNAFGQATVTLTTTAGETGQAVVTADISGGGNQCAAAAGSPTATDTVAGNCTDSETTNFVAASASPSATPTGSPSAGGKGTLSTSTPDIQPNIQGVLTASGLTSNAAYELRCYSRPSTTYFTARSATTSAGSTTLEFRILPGTNTRCYVRPAGNESLASNSVVINVHTTLSLSTVRTGIRTYIFQGRNLPRRAGQLITLYRISGGSEIRTSNLTTDSSGIYRVTRTFTGTGTFQFRVRTSQTLTNAPGASNIITVSIH